VKGLWPGQAEGYGEVDQEKAKLFPPKSFGFTSKPLASLEGLLWPGRRAKGGAEAFGFSREVLPKATLPSFGPVFGPAVLPLATPPLASAAGRELLSCRVDPKSSRLRRSDLPLA